MLREMGVHATLPAQERPRPPIPYPAPASASLYQSVPKRPEIHPVQERAAAAPTLNASAPVALAPANTPAVAGLDWEALRATVAACEACTLCKTRRQTVFGVGSTQAHWMVVGEAPGEHEDLSGEPFVGKAGQLLDRMLGTLGLARGDATSEGAQRRGPEQRVYIANALKCRPPRNRNPEREELERCEPYLVRQIELLQPRIILAMGRFAVQSLLRSSDAIGKLRGRVHRFHGVPLIVTYHPAYLLRNPADKARAWEDLCLAAHTVRATAPR
jgi:DNA polymerase